MIFCPQCGTANPDGALVCVECSRALGAQMATTPSGVITPGQAAAANVPNYLVFAILATVFCCLFTGIPAIVYAAQVNGKLALGDIAGAQLASKNAKMWCWISAGAGLLVLVFYALIIGFGILSHPRF